VAAPRASISAVLLEDRRVGIRSLGGRIAAGIRRAPLNHAGVVAGAIYRFLYIGSILLRSASRLIPSAWAVSVLSM